MSTASEEILDKYKKREKIVDKYGRIIVVKPLRPSQTSAIVRMADTDNSFLLGQYMASAQVCKIDEDDFTIPTKIGELNSVMDRLDTEGINKATIAAARLTGMKIDDNGNPLKEEESSEEKADGQ